MMSTVVCFLFVFLLVTVYSPKKIEQNKVSLKAFVRLNLNYFIHVKQCDTEAGKLDDQDIRVSANPPIVASFGYATSLNYWTPCVPRTCCMVAACRDGVLAKFAQHDMLQ